MAALASDGGSGQLQPIWEHQNQHGNYGMAPAMNGSYGWPGQSMMWPAGGFGQAEQWDGSWAAGYDGKGAGAKGEWPTGDAGEGADNAEESTDGKKGGRSKGKGKGRGKGGGKKGKQGFNNANGDQPGEFMFNNGAFIGDWKDSLGHDVNVRQGHDRRGPLQTTLTRDEKERVLSLRTAPESGLWSCGNAVLDLFSSGQSCLVWVTPDGRRSVWRKNDSGDGDGPPPDLLPWLLNGFTRKPDAEIPGDDAKANDDSAAPAASPAAADEGEEARNARLDSERVSVLLDARQVLGADRSSQELFTQLLMDHDLLRDSKEDTMVPKVDSPLWERLPETPRRNVLYRLAGFNPETCTGCPMELSDPDTNVVHVGRHRFSVASTDVQALRRRWSGSEDIPRRNVLMVHVVALYRVLETPLGVDWQRSSLQLGWDPVDRKRAGIKYELFASPFNASVENGKYGSRWPHVEKFFGSAGSYPSVIDLFPSTAHIGVNPPFTDVYLDHVMNNLDRLVDRFEKVHLLAPVRDAPWRSQLKRLQGATFVRQFWDATALTTKSMSNPVLYWQGSKLADP